MDFPPKPVRKVDVTGGDQRPSVLQRALAGWKAGSSYAWPVVLLVAVVSAYYAHKNYALQAERIAFAERIRHDLGEFALQGMRLAIQCSDAARPSPEADAEKWRSQLAVYFRENLDNSYGPRLFDYREPLTPSAPSSELSGDRAALCNSIEIITHNLNTINAEFGRH
jgi:hypothetical protein